MKITIWQNVEFENLAAINDWAAIRGHEISVCKTYLNEPLIIQDALIVLGGSMSVYDNVSFLEPVKSTLKNYLNNDGKVYGICLGAQLIAEALGANVYKSGTREIGWRNVGFEEHRLTSKLDKEAMLFHWHGDTFDLPKNATLLASNDAFKHQAFCANNGKILATQFHFEATRESLWELLKFDADYMNFDSPYINTDIFNFDYINHSNKMLFNILDAWVVS